MTTRRRDPKKKSVPMMMFGTQLYNYFNLPSDEPSPPLALKAIGWHYVSVVDYPGNENRLPFFRGYALPFIAVTPSSSHHGFYIHTPLHKSPDDTFIQCHGFWTPDLEFRPQDYWTMMSTKYDERNYYKWDETGDPEQSKNAAVLRRAIQLYESEESAKDAMETLIAEGNEQARLDYIQLSKRQEFEMTSLALKKLTDRLMEMDIDEIPAHVIPLWAKTFAELRRQALSQDADLHSDPNIEIVVRMREEPQTHSNIIDIPELRDV